ncbi:hypothetical protein Hanom_Chr14g01301361 [Helianthus anomalus]
MPRHRQIRSDDVEPMTLSPISLKINNPLKKKQMYVFVFVCVLFEFWFRFVSLCTKFRWVKDEKRQWFS